MNPADNFSPKEYLKNRRPEEFSSSIVIESGCLDRVQLEHYLSTLNTRSQELEFETFAKKLCEKIICPNLLEQTGPVAGGDGKTDTQTFPVSTQNQLIWHEGFNENSHNERWAFAVSTQKDWKSKCKKDVQKISETNRGYVKVFCITNQSVKADQRSKLEDELCIKYSIDVRILDLSWILDQIYKNKLEFLAIDSLSIPTIYKREIELSADDYQKKKEFDRLNKIIREEVDASKISVEQVNYFIEIAIISKELESTIVETQGLFDRAIRVAKRFGTSQQLLEASYQYAWAAFWWFDDFILFENNLELTFENLKDNQNSENWEKMVNLLIIYYGRYRYSNDVNLSEKIHKVCKKTISVLENLSLDLSRPSNALMASIHLKLLKLVFKFSDENYCKELLIETLKTCQSGNKLIGFPFEKFYNLFKELDIVFQKYEEYEELLDYFTEQSSLRYGEVKAAKLQLDRGLQRLKNGKPYQAIKLLGKAFAGLNKRETYDDMTYANILLSEAYSMVGLRWASRGSLLFSASLLANYFHKEQLIVPSTIRVYWQIAWKELELGRLPQSLKWAQLALLSSAAIDDKYLNEEELIRFDGCLAHLILNCRMNELNEFEYLPDFLEKLQFYLSANALKYALGHEDNLKDEIGTNTLEKFKETLLLIRDTDTKHPNSKVLPTLGKSITYFTRVAGCEFKVQFPNRSPFIEMSESILTTIENFFSTSLVDKIYTQISSIEINVIGDDDENGFISHEFKKSSKGKYVDIICSNFTWELLDQKNQSLLFDWFAKFIIECLVNVYHVPDFEKFIEASIKDDQSMTRSVAFGTCFGAIYNVMGKNAHQDILNTLNGNNGTRYELIRGKEWDNDNPKEIEDKNRTEKVILNDDDKNDNHEDIESIRHDQVGMSTLIKPELWDDACWYGLGYDFFEDKPPLLLLIFKEKEGINVFMDLYAQLGESDENERLRFTIVKGISERNPTHYKVFLSENMKYNNKHKMIAMLSRIHEMKPPTSKNLDFFELEYKKYGSYSLSFAFFDNDSIYTHPEFDNYIIRKKQILIKNIWELGVGDIERKILEVD